MFIGQKKITAFGLLLLMAIPVIFSVTVLVKQKIVQFQREERLETELLETITISAKRLHWVKPGKEIVIDGELFDVKSFKTEGDKTSLTGFFDYKEEKLVENIRSLIHQGTGSNTPFSQLALKFSFAPVYNDPVAFSFENSWHIITRQFTNYTEVIQKGSCPSAIHPPPEYC